METELLALAESKNVSKLVNRAKIGGFRASSVRSTAWPILLHIEEECEKQQRGNVATRTASGVPTTYPASVDRQIILDAERGFHFSVCQQWNAQERTSYVTQLAHCLHNVFSKAPEIHYYQGAHDIVSVCLMQVGYTNAAATARALFRGPLRFAAQRSMEIPKALLDVSEVLVKVALPNVAKKLMRVDVQTPFMLSWIITWFAHVIDDIEVVARIFDFLLVSHPVMPVYLSVALVGLFEEEILECGDEMSDIYMLLQNLPSKFMAKYRREQARATLLQNWIQEACNLADKHPPHTLRCGGAQILKAFWPDVFTSTQRKTSEAVQAFASRHTIMITLLLFLLAMIMAKMIPGTRNADSITTHLADRMWNTAAILQNYVSTWLSRPTIPNR